MADTPKQRFRALEKLIAANAREQGLPFDRVRRRLGQMLVCAVLSEAQRAGVIPMFFIKGGVALELRLGALARLTKDIDIGLVAAAPDVAAKFEEALAVGYGDFAFRIHARRELPHDTQRIEIQIYYLGLGWAKVEVDLSPASTDTHTDSLAAMHLAEFGFGQFDVLCLSIEEQVAQKLHGCTEPDRDDYQNPRSRDIFDVLIVDRQLGLDYARVQSAAERIFAHRARHAWPPDPTIRTRWHGDLRVLANENAYYTSDIATIQRDFTAIFLRILAGMSQKACSNRVGYAIRMLLIQKSSDCSYPIFAPLPPRCKNASP